MNVLVNIDVPDLDRATRFYCDGLGFEAARRFGDDGVELRAGPTYVYLLKKPARSRPVPGADAERDYDRHWTPVHLDLVTTELEISIARACAAGAVLETPVEAHAWGRIAGLADPFGNGFCILEFSAAGYDAIAR